MEQIKKIVSISEITVRIKLIYYMRVPKIDGKHVIEVVALFVKVDVKKEKIEV